MCVFKVRSDGTHGGWKPERNGIVQTAAVVKGKGSTEII